MDLQQNTGQLLEGMKVKVICTTDDPTDNLQYHKQIAKQNFYTKVLPTFRSDELFCILELKYLKYLEKLSDGVSFPIGQFLDLIKSIYFNEQNAMGFWLVVFRPEGRYGKTIERSIKYGFVKQVCGRANGQCAEYYCYRILNQSLASNCCKKLAY